MSGKGFRLDLPSPDLDAHAIGLLLVRHLGLALVESVVLRDLEIMPEQHRGSQGVDVPATTAERRIVDLSHPIHAGLVTYPGLPAPEITPFLTRADSRAKYAPGTEFAMDVITMIGNTGTYIDSPFHRYATGGDLSSLPLAKLVEICPPRSSTSPIPGRRTPAESDPRPSPTATCAERQCCCTQAGTASSAPPNTATEPRSSPARPRSSSPTPVSHWSASTRSTSTTPSPAGTPRALDPARRGDPCRRAPHEPGLAPRSRCPVHRRPARRGRIRHIPGAGARDRLRRPTAYRRRRSRHQGLRVRAKPVG